MGFNFKKILFRLLIAIIIAIFIIKTYQYFSKAEPVKANILVNTRKIISRIPTNWKALAQGGEEKDVQMLHNVIPEIANLFPNYIRIDHIYDFYDVVSRDNNGNITLNWEKLDATVCDIYHTGAKPFFALGYMPEIMSIDGSLISLPKNWDEWSYLVQATIERYSGQSTQLCGSISGNSLSDIYYEVWNEPDLEAFGKWSLYGGEKDYKKLYFYSSKGATNAQNVYNFLLGGPANTALYQSWIQNMLDYVMSNNLRFDFISWHHYSKNPDDYSDDMTKIVQFLSDDRYIKFRTIPKIISEWGYDSEPNLISETNVGAAHTVLSIRNLIDQNLDKAFTFEIKDGPSPRWGILGYEGNKKPRYNALKFLNLLSSSRLEITGEGTYVRALASYDPSKITLILVNFDPNNSNTELVPVTFTNLPTGNYQMTLQYLYGDPSNLNNIKIDNGMLERSILMPPNMVIAIELKMQ